MLAVVAIVITLVDVAGQRHKLFELKDTLKSLEVLDDDKIKSYIRQISLTSKYLPYEMEIAHYISHNYDVGDRITLREIHEGFAFLSQEELLSITNSLSLKRILTLVEVNGIDKTYVYSGR